MSSQHDDSGNTKEPDQTVPQQTIPQPDLSRRDFIRTVGLAAGSLSVMGSTATPLVAEETKPRMAYRRLGRTDLEVSVVVAGEMPTVRLHQRAFELGVNYWHKMGNWSHPEVFTKRDRESFYCDMVIDTLDEEGAIAQFEWGLQHAGLEMIDFVKVHSLYQTAEDVKQGEGLFRAFESLKKQGKTRFLAVAQHSNTAEVLTACIESGHFDAIQPAFNALSPRALHEMIALAKKHDVGVICKKVMIGGERGWDRRPGLRKKLEKHLDSETTLGQALLKWALAVPGVTAVVPLMRNHRQLEEDLAVGYSKDVQLGSNASQQAVELLAEALSDDYCRSCGECVAVCSRDVAVPDILRYTMYHRDYAQEHRARTLYHQLPVTQVASQCNGCGECESACPHGLAIVAKLREAHTLLA